LLAALWLVTAAFFAMPPSASAQPAASDTLPLTGADASVPNVATLRQVVISLPLATVLGAALAVRPRPRGTAKRSPPVVQTQIILAIIGALVMLVVGSSLARAFGVVGAAGLVRYRAKIDDPKDAGVMLSTLAIGLSCGVGLYSLAAFSALFIIAVLWVIESFEPQAYNLFALEVKSKKAGQLQPRVEELLKRRRMKFELRETSPEAICYEVQLPLEARTATMSDAIVALDKGEGTAVNWSPVKKPKA
jgi:Domain of unknown function (DUF4956)/MgtC family